MLTLGLWVAGHFNGDLRQFENVMDVKWVAWIARGLYYVLPNLAPFNVKAEVVCGVPVAASHVGYTLLYAAATARVLLTARRRSSAAAISSSADMAATLRESGQRPSNRWFHVATAGLLALSIAVQVVRDRGWQPYEPETPLLWFQSGPLLKRVSLGFHNLLADVYWIRAVVYYGSRRLVGNEHLNFEQLDPLLTFVTTLDPQFKVAYRFGAIFLAEAYPTGPGRPDRAIALLERGLAADPNGWEYMHDIGFVYYWWLHDYKAAGQWFDRASRLPNAGGLPALAGTTRAGRRSAIVAAVVGRAAQDGRDDWFKHNAELRLKQLDALDILDQLNTASQRFTAREGRPPQTWDELVAGERLRGIPLDPTGEPYFLDPATGHLTVSKSSSLWPLPTDQQGVNPGAPVKPAAPK